MKVSMLRKHYPSFTPDERFRLAIAALACRDDDDLALLRMSCPMKTYNATDHPFHVQGSGARELCNASSISRSLVDSGSKRRRWHRCRRGPHHNYSGMCWGGVAGGGYRNRPSL